MFATDDPPAVAVGLTTGEFEELVDLYRPRAATGGLTMVARSSTGEMMGVLLAEDRRRRSLTASSGLSPKFAPIFDILGELDSEYRRGSIPLPGDALHLFLLGVTRRFSRQGVAQRPRRRCIAAGGRARLSQAVTEATNPVSQHIFRKLGFVDRARRAYADHRFDGVPVFASIVGPRRSGASRVRQWGRDIIRLP